MLLYLRRPITAPPDELLLLASMQQLAFGALAALLIMPNVLVDSVLMSSSAPIDDQPCHRRELYVNFADINWDTWVVSSSGFNAYYCHGHCRLPLSAQTNATNHAIVQALVCIHLRLTLMPLFSSA